MIVRATFTGMDGSMGYQVGKEYVLELKNCGFFDKFFRGWDFVAWTVLADTEKGVWLQNPCPYSNVNSFLLNWDKIQSILTKKIRGGVSKK